MCSERNIQIIMPANFTELERKMPVRGIGCGLHTVKSNGNFSTHINGFMYLSNYFSESAVNRAAQ
jgi:hypothetical protein